MRGVLSLNKFSAWFDSRVVDGLVNLAGYITVVYSRIVGWFDFRVVDGLVNLSAWLTDFSGAKLRRLQTGNIQQYAYVAVLGVVVVLILKIIF